MKLKGSIAIFAVAAAFAGHVAAQTADDQKFGECIAKIGWSSFLGAKSDPTQWTGAWAGVNEASTYFQNSNPVACSIPKNKRESFFVGNMTAAQCGLYSKVSSAGTKFASNKAPEAQSLLGGLFGQTDKLVREGKLRADGKPIIDNAVLEAHKCVTEWIDMAN
jgi:hypothetical protein